MENNLDAKDVLLGGTGAFLIHKAKDPMLGVTSLYHGTTKDNAKGIKNEGLLIEKANSKNGATKWLADLIKEQEIESFKDSKGQLTAWPPKQITPTEAEDLYKSVIEDVYPKTLLNTDYDKYYDANTQQQRQKLRQLFTEGKLGDPAIFKDPTKKINYVVNTVTNDVSPAYTIDDDYILKKVNSTIQGIYDNTEKNVFVTKHRTHANLYSYLSEPGKFKELITHLGDVAKTNETASDTVIGKKLGKELIREYVKAQNPFTNKGKVVKIKVPTTYYDNKFVMDSIADSDEMRAAVEQIKTTNPRMYKILKNFQAKSGESIPTKYINSYKRPLVYAEAIKSLPKYIAKHPVKFTAGLGGVALGGYLLKDPISKL
jgi:hypothetical protein